MLRLLRNVLLLVALVLGVSFGFFNFHLVTLDLLYSETRLPLAVLLTLTFVLGFALALALLTSRIMGLRAQLARTRHQLKDAQGEIRNLRSMPIHDA